LPGNVYKKSSVYVVNATINYPIDLKDTKSVLMIKTKISRKNGHWLARRFN